MERRESRQPWRSYSCGFISWPPRSYPCGFCRREFRSAQALGGHMNVHRRDRARLLIRNASPPPPAPPAPPVPLLLPNLNDYPPPPDQQLSFEESGVGVLMISTATPTTARAPEDDGLDLELRLGVSSSS
ncbi:hypothetical protein EJB05_25571, partial [Eragrostis curvula]